MIIWAVLTLSPYPEGVHFTLCTYHDALKWLFSPASTSGKLARWCLRLQEFSFTVKYLSSKKNNATDAMSRLRTTGGEDSDKLIYVYLPIFSIEYDFNAPTMYDH